MYVYLIASSIKIVNKCSVFAVYRFKSARMVHVETYMLICMFLGCDLLMQMLLAAKIVTKHIIMMIDW